MIRRSAPGAAGPALQSFGLACLLCGCLLIARPPAAMAADATVFDVDVTFSNAFDKDFTDLPVVLSVARVFGRGVDYARFNRDGFHVYDAAGRAKWPSSARSFRSAGLLPSANRVRRER